MAKQPHNRDYYLGKIRGKDRGLYDDVMAGRVTLTRARQLTGLGGTRTRLHELKNAWIKATPQERLDFLSFAGLGAGSAASTGVGSAFDSEGRMLDWARRRVAEIMSRRKMSFGAVADELGLKRLNPSVMNAVHNGARIRSAATTSAIDAWLAKNASV